MSLFRPRKISWPGFLVFVAATVFTLYAALAPGDDTAGLIPWDKAKHFIVFYGLTFLATVALPRSRWWKIGTVLLAFGVGIEILQGLPIVGRDADVFDVVADTLGIGFFFGPTVVRAWLDGVEADQS
ncbi:VanZ family protein [Caulobacter sp. 1776]|uniref:VanZ family protein n=1 Tax=Caulobacter sp. 1776 TaxID=3156420 RepID=UPI003398AFD3